MHEWKEYVVNVNHCPHCFGPSTFLLPLFSYSFCCLPFFAVYVTPFLTGEEWRQSFGKRRFNDINGTLTRRRLK